MNNNKAAEYLGKTQQHVFEKNEELIVLMPITCKAGNLRICLMYIDAKREIREIRYSSHLNDLGVSKNKSYTNTIFIQNGLSGCNSVKTGKIKKGIRAAIKAIQLKSTELELKNKWVVLLEKSEEMLLVAQKAFKTENEKHV